MEDAERDEDSSSPNVRIVESIDRANRGDYRIVFSDGSALFIPSPVLTESSVAQGDRLDHESYEKLRLKAEIFETRDKAFELLARREHSSSQLVAKLRRRGHSEEAIEKTVGDLESDGYLDDYRFACTWIDSRIRKRNDGRMALLSGLRKTGVSQEISRRALDDTLDADYEKHAFAREVARLEKPGGYSVRQIARKLGTRGFPAGWISEYVENSKTIGKRTDVFDDWG